MYQIYLDCYSKINIILLAAKWRMVIKIPLNVTQFINQIINNYQLNCKLNLAYTADILFIQYFERKLIWPTVLGLYWWLTTICSCKSIVVDHSEVRIVDILLIIDYFVEKVKLVDTDTLLVPLLTQNLEHHGFADCLQNESISVICPIVNNRWNQFCNRKIAVHQSPQNYGCIDFVANRPKGNNWIRFAIGKYLHADALCSINNHFEIEADLETQDLSGKIFVG